MPRPRKYDPEVVVEKAMHVFWEKGYEATSVQDLVEATGINRFSMYQAFGDKRGLFLQALDYYFRHVLPQIVHLSEKSSGGVATIRRYFEALETTVTSPLGHRGCFGQNTGVELARKDEIALEPLNSMYAELDRNFERALETARERGSIRDDTPVAEIARFLVTIAQGMILMAKTGRDHHFVRSSKRQVNALLDRL
ncbi:MAG: TetR/AcrR family transcriptional regulator [Rhodothermales bacterium]|nr:TetR/AcrR family transcriptional regulator [Rhodothermales bacterium]